MEKEKITMNPLVLKWDSGYQCKFMNTDTDTDTDTDTHTHTHTHTHTYFVVQFTEQA